MSVIHIPRKHLRQPTGRVKLNQEFSCIAAVLMSPEGPRIISNAAALPFGRFSGNGIGMRVGAGGMGSYPPSLTPDYIALHPTANATNSVWERPKKEFTAIALVHKMNNTSGNAPIFGNLSPSTAPYSAWAIVDDWGAGRIKAECSAAGSHNEVVGSPGSLITSSPSLVAARYDGQSLSVHWGDGLSAAKTTSGDLVYPNDVNSRGPVVGNFWNYSGQRSFNGYIYMCALWDIAIPLPMLDALRVAPYTLFDADPIRIYSLPTGPIIPSISAVTMSNILQTSATTEIQLVF